MAISLAAFMLRGSIAVDNTAANRALLQTQSQLNQTAGALRGLVGGNPASLLGLASANPQIVFAAAALATFSGAIYETIDAVKRAASFDSLYRGLQAVNYTAEDTAKVLEDLREAAKLPGLGFREAIVGQTRLQGAGIAADQATKSITALANANAIFNGGSKEKFEEVVTIFSKIASQTKLSEVNLRQLAIRIPNIREILFSLYKTDTAEGINAKLQKDGKSIKDFVADITSDTGLGKLPKVAGGAENAFVNFGDAYDQALIRFGKPFLEPTLKVVDKLSDTLNKNGATFERWGNDVASVLTGVDKAINSTTANFVLNFAELATLQLPKAVASVVNLFESDEAKAKRLADQAAKDEKDREAKRIANNSTLLQERQRARQEADKQELQSVERKTKLAETITDNGYKRRKALLDNVARLTAGDENRYQQQSLELEKANYQAKYKAAVDYWNKKIALSSDQASRDQAAAEGKAAVDNVNTDFATTQAQIYGEVQRQQQQQQERLVKNLTEQGQLGLNSLRDNFEKNFKTLDDQLKNLSASPAAYIREVQKWTQENFKSMKDVTKQIFDLKLNDPKLTDIERSNINEQLKQELSKLEQERIETNRTISEKATSIVASNIKTDSEFASRIKEANEALNISGIEKVLAEFQENNQRGLKSVINLSGIDDKNSRVSSLFSSFGLDANGKERFLSDAEIVANVELGLTLKRQMASENALQNKIDGLNKEFALLQSVANKSISQSERQMTVEREISIASIESKNLNVKNQKELADLRTKNIKDALEGEKKLASFQNGLSEKRFELTQRETALQKANLDFVLNEMNDAGSNRFRGLDIDGVSILASRKAVLERLQKLEESSARKDYEAEINKAKQEKQAEFERVKGFKDELALKADLNEVYRQKDVLSEKEFQRKLSEIRNKYDKEAKKDKGFFSQLSEAFGKKEASSIKQTLGEVGAIFGEISSQLTQGVGSMVESWVLYGDAGPDALRKMTAQVLASAASQAAVEAIMQTAYGFAALASYNFDSAGKHFTSAAIFATVAAGAAIAGRAVAGDSFTKDSQKNGASGSNNSSGSDNNQTTYSRFGTMMSSSDGRSNSYSNSNNKDGFGNISGTFDAKKEQTDAINRLTDAINTFETANPGDVLMRGMKQQPGAVSNQVSKEFASDSTKSQQFKRNLALT